MVMLVRVVMVVMMFFVGEWLVGVVGEVVVVVRSGVVSVVRKVVSRINGVRCFIVFGC